MTNTVPDTKTVEQIASEIQFTKILQQMNKELKSSMVAIYISGFQIDIAEINDYDVCLNEYQNAREESSDLVYDTMKKDYPQLNIRKEDFIIIPGGPYKHNYNKEPDHDDLEAKLYWHSINDIVLQFFNYAKDTQSINANKVISLIKVVFELFKDFKELPKDPNLTNVLLKYLVDIFNKYSVKQFQKINEEIINDLKNNYEDVTYENLLNAHIIICVLSDADKKIIDNTKFYVNGSKITNLKDTITKNSKVEIEFDSSLYKDKNDDKHEGEEPNRNPVQQDPNTGNEGNNGNDKEGKKGCYCNKCKCSGGEKNNK